MNKKQRLITGAHVKLTIAITGASGVIYGKRLLEVLHNKKIETDHREKLRWNRE